MKLQFHDNRGAALIELALTTPLFLLLMVGAIELGRVAYFAIEVENAARAGASYGSVNRGNALSSTSSAMITQAAKNDAADLPNLSVTPGTACVCETVTHSSTGTNSESFNPSSGTVSCSDQIIASCTEDDATATQYSITYVTVATQANITPIFNFPGLPSSYALHGYAQLRTLQN